MKTILYVVSHAYPYFSNGYAVRTHHIAKALAGQGVKPIVLTRPGRPWDVKAFTEQVTSLEVVEDGVRYLSLPEPSRSSFTSLDEWKEEAAKAIVELCRVYRVDIIMAASNWQNAMPAQRAAQLLGLDFYYEVRGFWELSKAARFAGHEVSNEFKKHLAYETDMARGAKHVFTLTEQMKAELIERGVEPARISLVPNGVTFETGSNTALPSVPSVPSGQALAPTQTQAQPSAVTIGYIGSFSDYEGLDMLITALAELRKRGLNARLLLVGSSAELNHAGHCPLQEKYQQLAITLGVADYVSLPGRVTPNAVASYYQTIDIFVIPRLPYKVCEIVSPIKPLEAASYGKAILMSDVAPLADMAREGAGATFAKGSQSDLVAELATLVNDAALRANLAQRARNWVTENRQLSRIVEPMLTAFQR